MAKRAKNSTRDELIAAILDMKFGELIEIGMELAELNRHPTSASDFARLLYDWADTDGE